MNRLLPCFFVLFGLVAQAQVPKDEAKNYLQAGPMLGYSAMKEVMIWVQTNNEANVHIKYWEADGDATMFETNTVLTQKSKGFTAHLLADEVLPGRTYNYKLYINQDEVPFTYPLKFKTNHNWAYREDPPKFTVALGSCLYINDEEYDRKGKPYGGDYSILKSIHEKSPDLMLWLGDNTYYRPADWNTKTGMIYRNTHTRSISEMQPLLASTHHYAIWDDHDYGPNDHNRSFIHKETALDVFQLFWANPHYGFMDKKCAVSKFNWGDVDFYMLDDRWFRAANNLVNAEEVPYFGKAQIDWLVESLKASKANFKIIASGGQILNPAKVYENYANYADERAYLLQRLEEENIWGLFFLSGDRHHTELSKMERSNTYPLYDLTVSPLTSGTHLSENEGNFMQVENTLFGEQNFAILSFSGTYKEREMEMIIYNNKGKKAWSKSLSKYDLRPPRKEE